MDIHQSRYSITGNIIKAIGNVSYDVTFVVRFFNMSS